MWTITDKRGREAVMKEEKKTELVQFEFKHTAIFFISQKMMD